MSTVLEKALGFARVAVPLIGGFIIGISIPPEMTVMAFTACWVLVFLSLGYETEAEEFAGACGVVMVHTIRFVSVAASIGALVAAADAVLVGAVLIAGVVLAMLFNLIREGKGR